MMSGGGEMRIRAIFSYDDCAMKCKGMYSCLSNLGNQYLRSPGKKMNKKGFREIYRVRTWRKKRGSVRYERGTVQASACSVSATSVASR
jgi:hypothetical protein